jgi:hypothetical protein
MEKTTTTDDLTALRESVAERTEDATWWRVREYRKLMRGDAPSPMPRPFDFTEDAEVLLVREQAGLAAVDKDMRAALLKAKADYPAGSEHDPKHLRQLLNDRRAFILGALRDLDEVPARVVRVLARITGYTPENFGDYVTIAVADCDWRSVRELIGRAAGIRASLDEAAKFTPLIEEAVVEGLARERGGSGHRIDPPPSGARVADPPSARQTHAISRSAGYATGDDA